MAEIRHSAGLPSHFVLRRGRSWLYAVLRAKTGGAEGIRTPDPHNAIQALRGCNELRQTVLGGVFSGFWRGNIGAAGTLWYSPEQRHKTRRVRKKRASKPHAFHRCTGLNAFLGRPAQKTANVSWWPNGMLKYSTLAGARGSVKELTIRKRPPGKPRIFTLIIPVSREPQST